MLQTEVVKYAVALKKLEKKYNLVIEHQNREKASARANHAQLESLKKTIRGKGVDKDETLQNLLAKVELENQELKQNLNMPQDRKSVV